MLKSKYLFGLLFLFLVSGNLNAQAVNPDLQDRLQKKLDSLAKAHQMPGATFALVFPEGATLSLATGYEDREAFRLMNPNTPMLVGSTGKTFVAALVLQMAEQGKIHLDSHLSFYFGEEAWFQNLANANDITVRMLLQHTSGLPRYVFSDAFKKALEKNPDKNWPPKELIAFISHQPAKHRAGMGWSYSDTNYLLLGLLLEKVTKQSYYSLLQNNILDPLGLASTFPSNKRLLPGLSQGYIGAQDILGLNVKKTVEDGRYVINPQFEWTGGGLISTSEDLASWMQQLHGGQLISERMLLEMRLAVSFADGVPAKMGYGLGSFVRYTKDGDTHYGHEGIMPGYITAIEYSKKHSFSMAIQVNSDEGLTSYLHPVLLEMKKEVLAFVKKQEAILPERTGQN